MITHDFGVVAGMADILVMYAGKPVEIARQKTCTSILPPVHHRSAGCGPACGPFPEKLPGSREGTSEPD